MNSIAVSAVSMMYLISGAWPGNAVRLTGVEIETLFSGASMRGDFVENGSAWAERTTKSGRVLDQLQNGKHVGAWFVAGDLMCYIYFGKPPSTPCYAIMRDGHVLLFQEPRTGETFARATSVEPSRR